MTFKNSLFGDSNVSFLGKLGGRRVVDGSELDSHFLVAHEVGLYFRRILRLRFYRLIWRAVRLGELVLYYIKYQIQRSFNLIRQRLNLQLARLFGTLKKLVFKRDSLRADEV